MVIFINQWDVILFSINIIRYFFTIYNKTFNPRRKQVTVIMDVCELDIYADIKDGEFEIPYKRRLSTQYEDISDDESFDSESSESFDSESSESFDGESSESSDGESSESFDNESSESSDGESSKSASDNNSEFGVMSNISDGDFEDIESDVMSTISEEERDGDFEDQWSHRDELPIITPDPYGYMDVSWANGKYTENIKRSKGKTPTVTTNKTDHYDVDFRGVFNYDNDYLTRCNYFIIHIPSLYGKTILTDHLGYFSTVSMIYTFANSITDKMYFDYMKECCEKKLYECFTLQEVWNDVFRRGRDERRAKKHRRSRYEDSRERCNREDSRRHEKRSRESRCGNVQETGGEYFRRPETNQLPIRNPGGFKRENTFKPY